MAGAFGLVTKKNLLLASLLKGGRTEAEIYEAIGRLVTQYAMAEAALHVAAWKISGLSEERGRLIYSGMRTADIVKRVRGMFEANRNEQSIRDDFEACYTQLNVIGTARDHLVHRAVNYEEGKLKVSNEVTARVINKAESHVYSWDDLFNMRGDCLSISYRFLCLLLDIPPETEGARQLQRARGPWLYKPA